MARTDRSIATFMGVHGGSDLTVIWARDVGDGQVKGFVVEAGTPGFTTENLEDKIAV
jgi:alkylation response protein AidB-like acyl-CoA dehydrogenase